MSSKLSLYWKIFFAFTVGSLIVASLSIWLSHVLPVNRHYDSTPPKLLLHKASHIVRKHGPQGLRRWAGRASKKGIKVYLLDKQGNSIVGDPGELLEVAQLQKFLNRNFSRKPGRIVYKNRVMVASTLSPRHGPKQQLIIDVATPRSEFEALLVKSLSLRFMIAALLSAAICYILARFFTVPIRKLRHATKQMAEGNYDVQIAEDQTKTRDELKLLAQDFDQMAARVKESHNNQQRLIQDVSHELRSPLARIQMALGLLEQKDPDNKNSPEWQCIDKEVQFIDELVEQILSLPQKNISLDDAVEISALLQHCIDNCHGAAQKKSVALVFNKQCSNSLIQTRGRLLNGVFENILSNAIRHSPDNTSISIDCLRQENSISVTVRDQGRGVAKDQLEAIFEPFYRLSEARERDDGGTGLGLAIAKRSVLLHHGEITARNSQPGLAISVQLPLLDEL